MRKVAFLALMALLAAGCAPGVGGLLGEADLNRVLPGPGGTYTAPRWSRGQVPVPPVSVDSLTHPDPRISDGAYRTLKRLYDDIPVNVDTPPEYYWRFGMYWMARKKWTEAARAFDNGLKAMEGIASFDREGRDIWDYGYQRALAYLQYEPEKALRDAQILAAKAAPPVQNRMPQRLLALELQVRALIALKKYQEALNATDAYSKAWNELRDFAPFFEGYHAAWRVALEKGKALEGLGRLDEARHTYQSIVEAERRAAIVDRATVREAEERLKALPAPQKEEPKASPPPQPEPQPKPEPRASDEPVRKNPTEAAIEEAQKVAQGLAEALRSGDLAKADTYLAVPRFDPSLAARLGPEAKAKAASFRFQVGRVVLPSAAQAYITVELTYDFGAGPKTIRLPMLSGEAGQGLKVLNGTPSVVLGAILGLGDLPDKVNAFLEEYLKALGL